MKLRIAGMEKESVVDGPGLRLVIFTQGCLLRCEGCHNPHTHDLSGGIEVDTEELIQIIRQARLIRGVTFSGGEPFLQAEAVAEVAAAVKQMGMDVFAFSGYVLEDLLAQARTDPFVDRLLHLVDILVDGPYVAAERDLRLAFRGSRNQRLLDIPESLRQGRAIPWEDPACRIWAQ